MKAEDMHKRSEPVPDQENPEWNSEKFSRSVGFDALPANLRHALGKRGLQKAPKKVAVSIRLSKDVVDELRATGAGWQGRVDGVLKQWVQSKGHKVKRA